MRTELLRAAHVLRPAALAIAVAVAPATVVAQLPGQPPAPDRTADLLRSTKDSSPTLAPAPWVRPAPGTRLVYATYATTVTKASGWHISYVDDDKRARTIIGGVIRDSSSVPLALNEQILEDLWPLHLGARARLETQRYPVIWQWDIFVSTTERITVAAGTFDCYVIDAIVTTIDAGGRKPYDDRTLYWYAPSIGAIVRTYQRRDGVMNLSEGRVDLVRLERPGQPPIGVPAPSAPAKAPSRPR